MQKKTLVLVIIATALMGTSVPVTAQQPAGEQIVVDTADLPLELVAQLKARQKMKQVTEYVSWAAGVVSRQHFLCVIVSSVQRYLYNYRSGTY